MPSVGHLKFIVGRVLLLLLPFDVEQYQLVESERFHIAVVDDVETEIEETFVGTGLRLEDGPDVEFQFLEYVLVNDAVAVNEIAKERIFVDRGQVGIAHFYASGARGICLNLVHNLNCLWVL